MKSAMFRRSGGFLSRSLNISKATGTPRPSALSALTSSSLRRFAGAPPVRRPDLNAVSDADLKQFETILDSKSNPSSMIICDSPDSADMDAYNQDWLKKYRGQSRTVLKPKSTEQVASILRYCNEKKIGVSIQGGNTGLVGGSVPVFDELVLNLSRMDRIIGFNEQSSIVTVESGVILEKLDSWLRGEHGCIFPLDLGAKGSCQIGGNVSTNAGGLRLVRYGNLHGSVMGLEIVTASGEILDLTTDVLIKDNTGLDLKQLFIGGEGSLGVVTKVCVLCPNQPQSKQVMFAALESFEQVLQVKQLAKRRLNEILSAVEFVDQAACDMCVAHMPGARYPLSVEGEGYPFGMVIETHGSRESHDREKMEEFVEELLESGLILDGCLAEDMKQLEEIWRLREGVGPSINHANLACFKYDISLPLEKMYDVVQRLRVRIEENYDPSKMDEVAVMGYGHLGDGNLHINVALPTFDPEMEAILEPWIYEQCRDLKGSISAEHGLGLMKSQMIGYAKPMEAVSYMKGIKKIFDPNHILNPYKLLNHD